MEIGTQIQNDKIETNSELIYHGLQSLPPSPKRAERKVRGRPFREAGSGHKQWNSVSCVDTFSIISKFSAQTRKSKNVMLRAIVQAIRRACCLHI